MEKEEKKIELECDYCGVAIKETDIKCPNCGANCSSKVKKYKQQKDKEEEEIRRKNSEALQESFNKPVKYVFIFAIFGFAMVFLFAILGFMGARRGHDDIVWDESKGVVCKQDSYELYSYVSDSFPDQHNTPEGYQKIAFHVVCENNGDNAVSLNGFDVKLTADDYGVEWADLKVGSFERVEEGKTEYPSLLYNEIEAGGKLQGYVGYLVPKDKKVLKLTVKGTTTTLDNPVYEEE